VNTLPLQDILSANPFSVGGKTPIIEVLTLMERQHISCVLAVDADARPTGIFTEQDAVHLMATAADLNGIEMAAVMHQPVFTLPADVDYRDAYRQMSALGYRHLAVVDAAGRLIGVVSEGDFLHHLGMEYLVELKTVACAMTTNPLTLPETASLAEAVALLEAHHASCVIVARDDAPIGILTERDLVHLARQNLDLAATLLVNVMCAPVRSIAADYPLQDAIQQMEQAGIRRLAVLDGARLVGLVTRHDIVKTLQGRYIEYLQETINRQRLEMSRSQEQIHDVQQRLHTLSLLEQISDAIFVADAYTAELIEVNAQACRSLGYTRDALLGMKAMDLESGITDLDSWQAFLDELTNNDAWTLDTHHRRSDGSLLPVQIKARRIHSNARDYVVCVARDVSRTRQLDAQLELQIHALNAAGNAIVITDTEPRILWANAAFSALTSYSLEEALGQKPAELVSSGKQDRTFYQQMWETILDGEVWHGELVNKRKDGRLYDEDLTITPVRLSTKDGVIKHGDASDSKHEISHFIAVKQDITARKAEECTLRKSEAHFRLFYEHAPVAYESLDAGGRILEVNDEWLRQFGYPREQVIGRFIGDFLASGQDAVFKDRFSEFLRDGAIRKVEYDFIHHDGSIVTVAVDGLVDRDEQGRFKRTQCVLHNITARKQMEQELRYLAATDVLTGLANRRHFLDQMRLALARHQRHGTPTALLMIDLDWFKHVNDRYGHAVGDDVLQHFAHIIQASLRRIDLLGRLGGEEFAILLPDTEATGAYEFAERIRQHAAKDPATTQAGNVKVTLSIGVTAFSPLDTDTDVILARADRALYRAKENGRNRVELEALRH
jgi:diguanylate cyclase (GGDEF)-like protein/PAS domain S-box-containing protein